MEDWQNLLPLCSSMYTNLASASEVLFDQLRRRESRQLCHPCLQRNVQRLFRHANDGYFMTFGASGYSKELARHRHCGSVDDGGGIDGVEYDENDEDGADVKLISGQVDTDSFLPHRHSAFSVPTDPSTISKSHLSHNNCTNHNANNDDVAGDVSCPACRATGWCFPSASVAGMEKVSPFPPPFPPRGATNLSMPYHPAAGVTDRNLPSRPSSAGGTYSHPYCWPPPQPQHFSPSYCLTASGTRPPPCVTPAPLPPPQPQPPSRYTSTEDCYYRHLSTSHEETTPPSSFPSHFPPIHSNLNANFDFDSLCGDSGDNSNNNTNNNTNNSNNGDEFRPYSDDGARRSARSWTSITGTLNRDSNNGIDGAVTHRIPTKGATLTASRRFHYPSHDDHETIAKRHQHPSTNPSSWTSRMASSITDNEPSFTASFNGIDENRNDASIRIAPSAFSSRHFTSLPSSSSRGTKSVTFADGTRPRDEDVSRTRGSVSLPPKKKSIFERNVSGYEDPFGRAAGWNRKLPRRVDATPTTPPQQTSRNGGGPTEVAATAEDLLGVLLSDPQLTSIAAAETTPAASKANEEFKDFLRKPIDTISRSHQLVGDNADNDVANSRRSVDENRASTAIFEAIQFTSATTSGGYSVTTTKDERRSSSDVPSAKEGREDEEEDDDDEELAELPHKLDEFSSEASPMSFSSCVDGDSALTSLMKTEKFDDTLDYSSTATNNSDAEVNNDDEDDGDDDGATSRRKSKIKSSSAEVQSPQPVKVRRSNSFY